MSNSTALSNTMYDILKVMGKDAEFLYDTIDSYIKNAQDGNKRYLVDIWQRIKDDRLNHVSMLKDALVTRTHSPSQGISQIVATRRSLCGLRTL